MLLQVHYSPGAEQTRKDRWHESVPHCCSLWTWVSPATHLEEIPYKQRKPDSFWGSLVADLLQSTLMPAKDKTWERSSTPILHCCGLGPVCMSELSTRFPGWGVRQRAAVCAGLLMFTVAREGCSMPKHVVSYFKDENNSFSPQPIVIWFTRPSGAGSSKLLRKKV